MDKNFFINAGLAGAMGAALCELMPLMMMGVNPLQQEQLAAYLIHNLGTTRLQSYNSVGITLVSNFFNTVVASSGAVAPNVGFLIFLRTVACFAMGWFITAAAGNAYSLMALSQS